VNSVRVHASRFLTALAIAVAGGCAASHLQPPLALGAGRIADPSVHVGSIKMTPCLGGDYYCGTLRVALDPAGQVPGSIDLAIAWLPHANRSVRAAGTIVAVEGGPGYPSIGSHSLYRGLYAPLLQTRDLLLVDNRGTGSSDAIVCRPLQGAPVMRLSQVTQCGRELGRTSDLYGTAIAADDMAAVLAAMHITKVDIYGDSYGSFFVQAFAGRHPDRVRSIVLDGAYQVIGGSPWYPSTAPTLRAAFTRACSRSPVCSDLRGSSVERIKSLLEELRVDRDRVSPADVAFVMDTAGLDPIAYRDLDAAARAFLANDRAPLERLVSEAYAEEEGAGAKARFYSQGLFAAASCSDNPQAYDMRLPPPARKRDWDATLQRKRDDDPALYAPFSIDEFLNIPIDYAYVPLCLTWPVASKYHPAGEPVPPGTHFPRVPVLVLNGDLDTITTPAEGEKAAQLFAHSTHVIVANTGHVTALDDFGGCASSIVRRFTQSGEVSDACTARVPALHLVPAFSRSLDDVEPASPLPGNRATPKQLRAAAAALLAAADVLSRSYQFHLSSGAGLRGGTYSASFQNAADRVMLSEVRWTNDLAVSGTADLNARTASAQAALKITGAAIGALHAAWSTTGSTAAAAIEGSIDGNRVRASMPAP